MKYLPTIAGILLGLAFLAASIPMLFHLMDESKMPPMGPEATAFMALFGPTGYLAFIKWCELIGAILVMIPRTRNFGLLVLGPIIVNILAFHIFINKGATLVDPMLITICVLAAFLLWSGRKAFAGLAN
jgi:hypothetical protein